VPERLETERLVGERPRDRHAEDLATLLRDPQVAATLLASGQPASDRELTEQMLAKQAHWASHGFGQWMLYDRADGSFVGRGGLQRMRVGDRHEVVEVAWAIVPDRWGHGLATELALACVEVASEALGVRELVAVTLVGNVASRRVMEKAGFVYERNLEHAGLPHVLYRRHAGEPAATLKV
jgi:RimJ/RimL family protein N-acetyltransferase